jgi:hypothetical protein
MYQAPGARINSCIITIVALAVQHVVAAVCSRTTRCICIEIARCAVGSTVAVEEGRGLSNLFGRADMALEFQEPKIISE